MTKTGCHQPIICQIEDNETSLEKFKMELSKGRSQKSDLILNYPTVYIHNWKDSDDYEVYIGESGDVMKRTKQHFRAAKVKTNWQYQLQKKQAWLYVIGHEHFNKSLTLDIEHRLMLYLSSINKVKMVHNKKGNQQNKYYPEHELEEIFRSVWLGLGKEDKNLFPPEHVIRDSALYKASPLHKMTLEQAQAKAWIIEKAIHALHGNMTRQLIFVEGEAGTGKTVLNSSTFYDLITEAEELGLKGLQCFMMVNHDEQIRVYQQIADKLGLTDRFGQVVYKPTAFINRYTKEEPIDVAFIDEAHLLLTQGRQSYQGENQLQDIIDRARVTIVMFDENQVLTAEQYWEAEILSRFKSNAKKNDDYIELKNQLRMRADPQTIAWIDDFTKHKSLNVIPKDETGYEIRVFDQPQELEEEIKKKTKSEKSALSRMIATYDWEYGTKKRAESRFIKYWEVSIGKWRKPWNYQLESNMNRAKKKKIKELSWAEQPQTVNEVGSTFTIQGFDLSYAGVILGPSVKYRNGKIVFDPDASCNKRAVRNRTLSDGTKKKFGELLIQHEVRVLMTRGVEGLYLYACDEELRNALKKAVIS